MTFLLLCVLSLPARSLSRSLHFHHHITNCTSHQSASPALRANREMVLEACVHSERIIDADPDDDEGGGAGSPDLHPLRWASEELRNDEELVRLAMPMRGVGLQWT